MGRFCVSDAAYHELTNQSDDLPKSYLVKQYRNDMNKSYKSERTPGIDQGVQISFVDELYRQVEELNLPPDISKIKVKISGDGAQISKLTHVVTLSFAILDSGEPYAACGVTPIAIVRGSESYEMLAVSFRDTFQDINKLLSNPFIKIKDGRDVEIDLFLWADYKFLLTILGITGATFTYMHAFGARSTRTTVTMWINHWNSTKILV